MDQGKGETDRNAANPAGAALLVAPKMTMRKMTMTKMTLKKRKKNNSRKKKEEMLENRLL